MIDQTDIFTVQESLKKGIAGTVENESRYFLSMRATVGLRDQIISFCHNDWSCLKRDYNGRGNYQIGFRSLNYKKQIFLNPFIDLYAFALMA